MKKKIAILAFFAVMLFSFNTYAYKSASVTLTGDVSGSMTIGVDDLSGLMTLINGISDLDDLGSVSISNVTAEISYNNFQNMGGYITGGFQFTGSLNNGNLSLAFSNGPVYLSGTEIMFNNLSYSANISDSSFSCNGGSVSIAGAPYTCNDLASLGISMEVMLLVLML